MAHYANSDRRAHDHGDEGLIMIMNVAIGPVTATVRALASAYIAVRLFDGFKVEIKEGK